MKATTNRRRAFSLLEMLVVIGIIAIMMSLLVPAIGGFSSTAGRRGAVNIVMNTLEQARVAALESGQTVYVGFADDDAIFTSKEMNYAAFIVFRQATPEEAPKKFVVLKNWTKLPKNIAFKRLNGTLIPQSGGTFLDGLKTELSSAFQSWDQTIPVLAFNSSGAVEEPSTGIPRLFLYEGYFAGGQDNFTRNKSVQDSSAGLFEQISLARYTGRVQLDITATGS